MTVTANVGAAEREPGNAGAETVHAVSATGVVRRFGTTTALGGVDITLRAGEIHALLGENGAGKTTFVRMLAGLDRPDAGSIELWGTPVDRFDARAARRRGVALVQQHFTLVPTLTAAENLVLARPTGRRLPRRRAAIERVTSLSERYGLAVRADVPVSMLSVGEQQRLEILRALDADASILLLDEPTAVLTAVEADALMRVCRRLADEGRAVAIITHRLAEVTGGCDRVTVLRDGAVVVADAAVAGQTTATLAAAMVGRTAAPAARRATASTDGNGDAPGNGDGAAGSTRLRVDRLTVGRLRDVSFEVRRGEVLGIAGVDGNGQAELEDALAGVRRPESGSVTLDDVALPSGDPRRRIERRIAYIPSDRYRSAMVRPMTLADNLELGRGGRWRERRSHRQAAALPRLVDWDVRSAGPGAPVRSLSGGNAQKLVLSRELHGAPDAVVACHPTRGLDPLAARTIIDRVLDAASNGAAVVWIGVELEELLAVSDRIVVLSAGAVTGEFSPPFDRDAIGLAMGGGT